MAITQSAVARLFGWTAAVFYHVEQVGGPLPDGPVLVTVNHPNALLDPLLIFRTAGRPARPLAKAPLFEQVFVGTMLRGLGGLPVYRKQDDPTQMHRNDETFRRAIDALVQGDAVQIFPEGRSHSEPGLVPLRTGAARIALGAEAQSNWQLGLHIVPVGITYRRKALFRGRALVHIGEPFRIGDLRGRFESDAPSAVRALTERIAEKLAQVTLNLTQQEDQQLIETAETLYVREKGLAGFREREGLSVRMPRLQRFARGLAWLRAEDPLRHERLRRAVLRYRRTATLLGVHEGDVPRQYAVGPSIRYTLRTTLALVATAPLAVLGTLLWVVPYILPRLVVRLVRPEHESIATYKLAAGFFVFPVTLGVYAYAAWRLAGVRAAIATLVLAPLAGFIALGWHEAWRRFGEDVRLFWRVLLRKKTVDRLADLRAHLAREFDHIDRESAESAGAAQPVE